MLEVLDPGLGRPVGQGDLALLGLFADQAAIALDLVRNARRAHDALDGAEGTASSAARLRGSSRGASDAEAWTRVLDALGDALDAGR